MDVKDSKAQILTNKDGIIIDLDASLVPNEKILIRRGCSVYLDNIGDYVFEQGDETLTWDKNNNVCWKKILNHIEHDWNDEVVTITTETGKQITVTCNHSVFGVKKEVKKEALSNEAYYLIDAGKLQIGDYVIGCQSFESSALNMYFGNVGLEKITKIEKQHYSGKVYDLSVEDTERFFAGSGIGAHNSSLYPSMINQMNISFDTFFGRIIDPITYNFLTHIEKILNSKSDIPQQIYSNAYELIVKFVDRLKPQNKSDYVQNYYLVLAYMLKKVSNSGRTMSQLFEPETIKDYLLLKKYLLPAIDLFDDIHPKSKEYNSFCNEYLINDSLPVDIDYLFIIENILQPNIRVKKISVKDFEKYLKENNLIITLSGSLFTKHEIKKGLFIDFLKNLKKLRTSYETEMKKYPKNSKEYDFYNMRQKAIKITMNTTLQT